MWHDFYPLFEVGRCSFTNRAMLALLAHLGFDPPIPVIGDLLHPDSSVRKRNRENFAKFWGQTREQLKSRGWNRIGRGSIAELYVSEGKAKRLSKAWLDPIWQPNSLRIRLYFRTTVSIPEVANAIRDAPLPLKGDIQVDEVRIPRAKRQPTCVDVKIPQRKLFQNLDNSEGICKRLSDFVMAVFDVAG